MPPKIIKIVLVGNSSVGKTCVVKKATTGLFAENSNSTLGVSYVSKIIKFENEEISLQIWDTAGQERYRGMAPMYYRGANVAVIVYSINDSSSFAGVDAWYQSIHENADKDVVVFLVANKIDLKEHCEVTTEQGESKASEMNANFFETSAKTGFGIDELFEEIAKFAPRFEKMAEGNDKAQIDPKDYRNRDQCCK